ncbi:MAG: cell division protein FtsZ [Candidatus Paceibacterota bacterium]|jgi:cell division protein FtsZ
MVKKEKKEKNSNQLASIKVVGVGGAGGNMVSRMSRDFVRGVDFIAINTDHQDLDQCDVRHKIYIGRGLTRGLGTGMSPEIGQQAADENRSEIVESLSGSDIIFLAAGFGGGTGTGASPVVAEVAKQTGALTLAFVTRPFAFEGSQRDKVAQEGIQKLRDKVDALIVIPNDRVFTIINKDTTILKAFEVIDDVLKNALRGVVELIVTPGIINVDFADVRSIIQDAGSAIVGMGIASGQDRAVSAVNQALNSPLLETSAEGAKGVILGISGSRDLKMTEVNEAAKIVAQVADPGARIIFGAYYDRRLRPNQLKVTLIATGFSETRSANSLFGGSGFDAKKRDFFGEAKSPFFQPDDTKVKLDKELEILNKDKKGNGDFSNGKNLNQGKSNNKEEEKKKEKDTDIWDIPTFLRKRRK